MRKVIDTNFLKSKQLREYLADPNNAVVLPEFVMIETLAGGDPVAIWEQFQILSQHSKQVIFLKRHYAVCGRRSKKRSRGLQKRLIEEDQTADFQQFCKNLELAKDGDPAHKQQLAQKSEAAAKEIATFRKGQETYAANLAEHAKKYTEAELAILAKGEPIPDELRTRIARETIGLADAMFMSHGYFKKQPPTETLSNAFLFRFAIAGYVVALRCLKEGGQNGIGAKNIGNQLIDAIIATYATYFDGFLSDDKRAGDIYDRTAAIQKDYHHDMQRWMAAKRQSAASGQEAAGSRS